MRNQNFLLSYIDLLMNLSISFAAIFMLAIILINDPTKKDNKADERAKLLIVMTWDPNSSDDLDVWIRTPDGSRIGYSNPNGLVAHLQRDDMGSVNDFVDLADGTRQYMHFNQEISSVRSMAPGHYVVNVEFYRRHPDPVTRIAAEGPATCTVELIQVDPSYKALETRSVTIDRQGEEQTAFSFDIANDEVQHIAYEREPFVM